MVRLQEDFGRRLAQNADATVALAQGTPSARKSHVRTGPFPNEHAQRSHINRVNNKPLRKTYIDEILFNMGVLDLKCTF